MDEQGGQHTTLTYHELQNTLIVVWSCMSGNTSTDMVCHKQEGTIPGRPIAKWGGAAFWHNAGS